MKISYSRYSAFLTNPERYRLYYGLGLVPESDSIPGPMNYGRRRGTCVHAIHESNATGKKLEGTFEPGMVARCTRLVALLPDLGDVLLSEESFDCPIGDGKHQITGRLDHVVRKDGETSIGDLKSTKKRTKKEMREYFDTLETSSQSHFYLYAAAKQFNYPTEEFTYHVLVDDKEKPEHIALPLRFTPAEVNRTMMGVYAACEAIEGLIERVGLDKPWPHSNTWPCCGQKQFCGYGQICGRPLAPGFVPVGFISRHPEEEIV